MALLNSCLCCSLLTGCILTGITSMVLYLMSFSIEMWWIVEANVRLPIPSYLLVVTYLVMSILSFALLAGLRTQRTRLLLIWLVVTFLIQFPEAGMVLFMAIYYWSGDTYGIIELGMWIFRIIFAICGMICTQSLYSSWKEEKSLIKSLEELNNVNNSFLSHGDYSKHLELGYQNAGYSGSQHHLNAPILAITKYSTNSNKSLKRSLSSASQFVSASRISLNDLSPNGLNYGLGYHGSSYQLHQGLSQQRLHQLNAAQLTGYRRNEFDTTKFTSGLAWRTQSQYDLPSFGMDPDAPIFLTGYGPGGLPNSSSQLTKRPDSALQWYRPRSLINLDDDSSSVWSDDPRPSRLYTTQSLDRRKRQFDSRQRAQSTGALNFGYLSEEGILRGSVGLFNYSTDRNNFSANSHQSIGQFSDHVDKYRDVAL